MADEWQPGDLALCVRNDPQGVIRKGGIYTVEKVRIGTEGRCNGVLGLKLAGVYAPGTTWGFYAAFGFRKIRPHTPDEEDRETIRLLNGQPVSEPA